MGKPRASNQKAAQQYNQLAAPASQDAAFCLCSKSQKDFQTSKLFAKYGNDGEGLRHILIGHRKEFGPFIKSLPTTKTQIDKEDEKLLENYIRSIIRKNNYIGMGKKQSGNMVYYFDLKNDKTMAVCIHAKGGKKNPVYITTAYVVPHGTAMTHIGNMKPRSNTFKILFVLVFIAIVVYLLSKLYFHFH